MTKEEKSIVLRMVYSISMADHAGDALEAAYEGCAKLGFNVPESLESQEDIQRWLKKNGVTEGIYA